MNCGRVYAWIADPARLSGGYVAARIEPLPRLAASGENARLCGRFVRVRNAGAVYEPDAAGGVRIVPLGDARPDAHGDFLFEPGRGGRRMDKTLIAEDDFRWRYVQASHFGEVNTYYHLDRIAAYVDELLRELGGPALPRVTAVVNAHHAATEENGARDGVWTGVRWRPFQGGHYRLPSRRYDMTERDLIAADGEIHLGPGYRLVSHGALVEAAGGRYRANASHNAGTLYHEYGHHICRHTADFRANRLRRPERQSNRKTALDEGTSDYWAATLLGTPHIWAWHRRHDEIEIHPRSLASAKTMADFDTSQTADAHANGTIWAAALWDVRTALAARQCDGARRTDLLVLRTLLLLGTRVGEIDPPTVHSVRRTRGSYAAAFDALLHADELLNAGGCRDLILAAFTRRGICAPTGVNRKRIGEIQPATAHTHRAGDGIGPTRQTLMKHVLPEEIPADESLCSRPALEARLAEMAHPRLSLIAAGDLMLGARARRVIAECGADYPFEAVRPLLDRASLVMANLEGPFARKARRQRRRHSYRVDPALVHPLVRAGVSVVTLANNHLLDCGRAGVVETLEALAGAGVGAIGGGINREAAHTPLIRRVGPYSIGLLGYYWNRRCAATDRLPGSATDTDEALETDIRALRGRVDRVLVTFHWGIPYDREPAPAQRDKARRAVDCGADIVIAHHQHVVLPFEIYRGRPIFYGVGNFAFGSGNSRGEGLLVGVRFEDTRTLVYLYALYVKNRDPRVAYQPKVMCGEGAVRVLRNLAQISGTDGGRLQIQGGRGILDLPRDMP